MGVVVGVVVGENYIWCSGSVMRYISGEMWTDVLECSIVNEVV